MLNIIPVISNFFKNKKSELKSILTLSYDLIEETLTNGALRSYAYPI